MSSATDPTALSASVHPTTHPLVARCTITLPADTQVTVEFGTTTQYGRSTSPVPAPAGGGSVSILVAGMMAATTYHMRARIRFPDGKWLTTADALFRTGVLPNIALPTLAATTSPNRTPSPGVELVNVIDPTGISAVSDIQGNILWYYDNAADSSWKGYAFPIRPLPSFLSSRAQRGNMLASITNLYSAGVPKTIPYNSVLREIDLVGNPVRELSLADLNAALKQMGSDVQALCYSHDVLPLWNGHTILLVQEQRSVWLTDPPGPGEFLVLGDALVDLDENFNPVWTWSTFDHLDVNRHPYQFPVIIDGVPVYDWTHCNCVQIAPDGNLVLSSRHQNWVMKIDYEGGNGDGTILWRLGYQGDFTLAGNATADTDWFFAQHFPNLLSAAGNQITSLSVMDNGNDRCYAMPGGCDATSPPPPPAFTRAAIFKIDETAMTAQVAWQYPLNQYSFWGGNVMQLFNGDIEICASEPVPIGAPQPPSDVPSQVLELTTGPSGPESPPGHPERSEGSVPEIVWQMTVSPGGAYRSYRIPSLYPGVIWGE